MPPAAALYYLPHRPVVVAHSDEESEERRVHFRLLVLVFDIQNLVQLLEHHLVGLILKFLLLNLIKINCLAIDFRDLDAKIFEHAEHHFLICLMLLLEQDVNNFVDSVEYLIDCTILQVSVRLERRYGECALGVILSSLTSGSIVHEYRHVAVPWPRLFCRPSIELMRCLPNRVLWR